MENQYLMAAVSIFCALLTMLPEIAAYITDRKSWVPINVPRLMRGDDYHHFSILNKLSNSTNSPRTFLNCISEFARSTKMQIPGYLILLPVYLISSFFFGKRFAISFVRFACRFALFFSSMHFFREILERLGFIENLTLVSITSCVLFFLSFPGFTTSLRNQNLFVAGNIQSNLIRTGSYSELTRAFILELSAPVFLISSIVVLKIESRSMVFKFLVTALLVYLISSIYPPLAIVFVIFNSIEFYNESRLFLFLIVSYTVVIVFLIRFIMRSDEVGREIFVESSSKNSFDFAPVGKKFVTEQVVMLGFIIVSIPSKAIVFALLGILIIGSFNKGHNLSRLWYRSGVLGFHILLITGFGTILAQIHQLVLLSVFAILLLYLIYFFAITAIKTRATEIFHLPDDLIYSEISNFDQNTSSFTVISSTPEKSFIYSLYGSKVQFWECYFLSNKNYIQNFTRYVQSQRIAGQSDEVIMAGFFSNNSDLLRFMVFYLPYNFNASQKTNKKDLQNLINDIKLVKFETPIAIF